jgi:hypothetical protein
MGSKKEPQDRSPEANAAMNAKGEERKESAGADSSSNIQSKTSVVAFKPWGEASGLIFVPDDDVVKIDHDDTTVDNMNASIKAEEFDQSFRLYNIIAHRRVQAAEKQSLYSTTNDEEGEEEEEEEEAQVQVPEVDVEAERRKAQELSDLELVRALQEERAIHRALQEAQLRSSEHGTRVGRSRGRASGRYNAFDDDPLKESNHSVRRKKTVVSPAAGSNMRKPGSNPRLERLETMSSNDGDGADMDRSRRGSEKPRRKKSSGSCPLLLDDRSNSCEEEDSPRAGRKVKNGPQRKEGQLGDKYASCGRTGKQVAVRDISGEDSDEEEARDKKSRRGPRSRSATRLLNTETTKPIKRISSVSGLSGLGNDDKTASSAMDRKSTRGPRTKRRSIIAGNSNTDAPLAPQNASGKTPKAEKSKPRSSKSFDDTLFSDGPRNSKSTRAGRTLDSLGSPSSKSTRAGRTLDGQSPNSKSTRAGRTLDGQSPNSKSTRAGRTLDGLGSHQKTVKPIKGDHSFSTRTTATDISGDDSDDREDRKSRRRLRTSGSSNRLDQEASALADRKKTQGPSIKRRSSIGSSNLKTEKRMPRRTKSLEDSDAEQSDYGGNDVAKGKRSSSVERRSSRRAKDDSSSKISIPDPNQILEMLSKNTKHDAKEAQPSRMPNKSKSSGALNLLGPLPNKAAKSELEKLALGVLAKHSMRDKSEAPLLATSHLPKKAQDSKMPRKTISFCTLDSVGPILSRRSKADADKSESGDQTMRNAAWGKPSKQPLSKMLSAKEQSINNFQAMLEQQKATKAKLTLENQKDSTKETKTSRMPKKCKSLGAPGAVEAAFAKLGAVEMEAIELQTEAMGLIVSSLSSKTKSPSLSNEKKANVLPAVAASKPTPDSTRLKELCQTKIKTLQAEVDNLSASNAVGLIASGWSSSKKKNSDLDFPSKRSLTSEDDAKSLREKASRVSGVIKGLAAV